MEQQQFWVRILPIIYTQYFWWAGWSNIYRLFIKIAFFYSFPFVWIKWSMRRLSSAFKLAIDMVWKNWRRVVPSVICLYFEVKFQRKTNNRKLNERVNQRFEKMDISIIAKYGEKNSIGLKRGIGIRLDTDIITLLHLDVYRKFLSLC